MTSRTDSSPSVAIACGGTGGHLFPGLAVAQQLAARGCRVTLIVSPKEVDQQGVKTAFGVHVLTLPSIGLTRGKMIAFVRSSWASYNLALKHFRTDRPEAVLAMGGFTSAPPVLAGKRVGARTFLHESNTIPGRANRWLSWIVDECFTGFPHAAARLHNSHVTCTGTPVRLQFQQIDAASCRTALGLHPDHPTLLVTGGSQGAGAINELVIRSLPLLKQRVPDLQMIHLAGPADAEKVKEAAAGAGVPAVVHSFFARMDLALGAATVAVSRAGASSMAELAAMRLPAVLVPYPSATDNHQFHNAKAFDDSGAARLLDQNSATPELLAESIVEWMTNSAARQRTQDALGEWNRADAAVRIAEEMLAVIARRAPRTGRAVSVSGMSAA